MTTTSIEDFARYSIGYASASDPARCFIDADNMTARSVFNIGTWIIPVTQITLLRSFLKKTAPFRALLQIDGQRLKQKQIAEWLEDWSDYLLAFDADGNTMQISQQLRLCVVSLFSKQHSRTMKLVISLVKIPDAKR